MPTNKNDKQIIDVGKPGTTQPTPTSRPVVTGHRMIAEDPMLSAVSPEGLETAEPAKEEIDAPRVSKKVIVPIGGPSKEGEDKAVAAPEKAKSAEEVSNNTPAPDTASEETTQEAAETTEETDNSAATVDEQEESKPSADAADSAVVDVVAEQADKQKKSSKSDEEEKKKLAAVNQLVTEKKYFVPIAHETKHQSSITVILFLIVFAAVAYMLVDAGVFGEVDLPLDLIPN